MEYILHNDQLIPKDKFFIPLDNRAFLFADGFFETMVFKNGSIRFIDDHLERINEGIDAYAFEYPELLDEQKIVARLTELGNKVNADCIIKVIFHRKSGGLYLVDSNEFEIIAMTRDLNSNDNKKNAGVVSIDSLTYSKYSSIKNLSAREYIEAGRIKSATGVDELILLNKDEEVCETLYANIFWMRHGVLFTPSLETGCINGVSRRNILRLAESEGIEIAENKYTPGLFNGSEIVFTSNVTGTSTIEAIEDYDYAPETDLSWIKIFD